MDGTVLVQTPKSWPWWGSINGLAPCEWLDVAASAILRCLGFYRADDDPNFKREAVEGSDADGGVDSAENASETRIRWPATGARSRDPPQRLLRRTFFVAAASIAALRDRGTNGATRTSAFVALSAFAWLTFLRAKGVDPDDHRVSLCFLADCRRLLDPPVGDEYFGNCVRPCVVDAKAKDLLDGDDDAGFKAACAAIRRTIDDYCSVAPLGHCGSWFETLMGLPTGRLLNISASPRFRVYDHADFGWGRPRRVELLTMNKGGEVALVAARDEEGAVQATVALSPVRMDGFTSLFQGGLKRQA